MDIHFYKLKDEVRILGLDDGPFDRGDDDVLVVGTVFRGGKWLDGVVSTRVKVDGMDATEKLTKLINDLRFKDVRIAMIDGIAFGGFNVVDIGELHKKTGLAIIAVTRDEPDFKEIKKALAHTDDAQGRYQLMIDAGTPMRVSTCGGGHAYIQCAGISEQDAKSIIKISATRSHLPEPIRAAHIIASGIILGQSRGHA